VKGVKSSFTQLSNWLQEMYANSKKILSFFEQDEQNIQIYFSSIKPSVLSKEEGRAHFVTLRRGAVGPANPLEAVVRAGEHGAASAGVPVVHQGQRRVILLY
jgi:hypothetical protein